MKISIIVALAVCLASPCSVSAEALATEVNTEVEIIEETRTIAKNNQEEVSEASQQQTVTEKTA